ncbi:Glu/Leu/Phe/Val dehydrogenase [Sporosarcina contaminans]|uniref:Glutamate dehydrogenase n=1 Tax=Sporosarcina contaminans TaxID=633403 RepID=A0ABW3U1P2_9BACL
MKQSYLVTEWVDQKTGAKGYMVIDELKGGFCAGGIRMRQGVTKEEVVRLAETMTIKMAGLGMAVGGAKGGIDFPSNDEESEGVLKRYLEAHAPYIKEYWLTSEDLGTREEDIVRLLNELGIQSSVQAFISKQNNKQLLMKNLQEAMTAIYEGQALTELVTGYGVAVVTEQALKKIGTEPAQAKVSIQGFGSVGASAAKFLYQKGFKIVAVADIDGTIYYKEGLDIDLLLSLKDHRGNINRNGLPERYEQLSGEKWLELDVDVLIPAAIADVINAQNVRFVKANLIVEGANLPVTEEAEAILFEKGVPVIPDFIANSGGAGLFVAVLDGNVDGKAEEIFTFLGGRLTITIDTVLTAVAKENIPARKAAKTLVESLSKEESYL